jgi:RNA polymerase sigma-70 factor (ECF subfamily)
MTGSAADADDLTQDVFLKMLSSPPEREPGPWLTRVAVNGGIDLLRERRRRAYVGPWLPEPIDTGDLHAQDDTPAAPGERTASHRYDLLESASLAFLVALEALTPKARAVLLLCDVFDLSVKEVATLLSMTETHVKVTHHRARRVMQTYDAARTIPTRALQDRTRAALATLMTALITGDLQGASALLAEDVVTTNDSAGEFLAARVPVVGRAKVAIFWMKVSQHQGARAEVRMLNGLPGLVVVIDPPPPKIAPRIALQITLGQGGLVSRMNAMLATGKLARLAP